MVREVECDIHWLPLLKLNQQPPKRLSWSNTRVINENLKRFFLQPFPLYTKGVIDDCGMQIGLSTLFGSFLVQVFTPICPFLKPRLSIRKTSLLAPGLRSLVPIHMQDMSLASVRTVWYENCRALSRHFSLKSVCHRVWSRSRAPVSSSETC